MKTNFLEYLKKKKAQTIIDNFVQKYEGKKVVLYGAGLFAGDLLRNYDLSKLNIISVADMKFKGDTETAYYGYPKLAPEDLLETEFDLLLITTYDDKPIKDYFKDDLFQGEDVKFEIKPLIRLTLLEYIKGVIKGEV